MTTPALDPATYATTAQAVIDNAQRNGLTWRLVPGTVLSSGGATVSLIIDGDDTQQSLASSLLTPAPSVNDRVMVLVVPPQGNYVIGYYGPPPEIAMPRLLTREDAAFNTSAIGVTETNLFTTDPVLFRTGYAYRAEWSLRLDTSAANAVGVRVRQAPSVTGPVLDFWTSQESAAIQRNYYNEVAFVNTTGRDFTDTISLSIFATAGTVTVRGAVGGANPVVWFLEIYAIGRAELFPNATAMVAP